MKDTIIKGSGNSREIKSVPNFASLYPTWESFRDAFGTKGIPIDLLGLVAAGVDQIGTDLNKANLLTDATEQAIWGSAADRTPDAALRQLRTLITTAQSTADGRTQVVYGSYQGVGDLSKTLTFPISPNIVIIGTLNHDPIMIAIKGFDFAAFSSYSSGLYSTKVDISGNTILITGSTHSGAFNNGSYKYIYIAIK